MSFEIKGETAQEVHHKMAIISDMHCENMTCRDNKPRAQWYREYCEYVYKICGVQYKLYPPGLINGTLREVLAEYKTRCSDIHLNPEEFSGDLSAVCAELYAEYGEPCHLPPSNITKWTYEKLANFYVSSLPYYELLGLGI
jgi:hypothetical protein